MTLAPRTKYGLTNDRVLLAVKRAVDPYSIYIGDRLRENQAAHVIAHGGVGYPPTPKAIYVVLKRLEKQGLLTRPDYPDRNGYYGYRWKITEAGHARLSEIGVTS